MSQRILYFILGCVSACALCSAVWLWDSFHDNYLYHSARQALTLRPTPAKTIETKDLVGIWHGKESWGNTYVINRKQDGTFTEVYDTRHGDSPWRNPIVRFKGYWSISGSLYAYCYTGASDSEFKDHRPKVFEISSITSKELNYQIEEGCWTREKKE